MIVSAIPLRIALNHASFRLCVAPALRAMSAVNRFWPARGDVKGSSSLNLFLAEARRYILKQCRRDDTDVHVFLGNEAADLDSLVSSLALAYWHSSNGHRSLPLINCPRSDLRLRGDVVAVLSAAGLNIENFVFIDETPDLENRCSKLWLVDHNQLSSSQTFLKDKVTAIVDHHVDSSCHQNTSPRVIQPVGSCSTLSFELCSQSQAFIEGNRTLSSLLLAVILVDTGNMNEAVGRGTPRDLAALNSLSETLNIDKSCWSSLFDAVNAEKQNQVHLSTRDLLRRDYKQYTGIGGEVGIASVGLSLGDWSNRNSGSSFELTGAALRQFAHERCVDVLVVMTSFRRASNFTREIVICPSTTEKKFLYRKISSALQDVGNGLILEHLDVPALRDIDVETFVQKNLQGSRKVVAPIVVKALE